MKCPPLHIRFLGTGTSSGVPMIGCSCEVCRSADKKDNRLRSSILVESAETTIVIDTTPDFRYQMLREKVTEIDALLYTHLHKDHIAGMDDVRAFNYFMQRPVDVFANAMTKEALLREFAYAFSESKFPGLPEISLHEIDESPFLIGDIPVMPILVWHFKMPVFGFRIGNFTYITDANRIEKKELEKISGTKILVLNALRKETHHSHFTLAEAVAVAGGIQAEKTYFTHLSHQMGLHTVINRELPAGMELAWDGLQLQVPAAE